VANGSAIAGIGATEFAKDSGRSELRLALECATAALNDAGVGAAEVDGLVAYGMDNNDVSDVARYLGCGEITFYAQTPLGGGSACGTVALAALAVATGAANIVIAYRAMNERSGFRYGQPTSYQPGGVPTSFQVNQSWTVPFGMATPAVQVALTARRYMHQYGATSADFGLVAVSSRNYAVTNPQAWFYGRPITLDDHQNSRMIADPIRLLDCCQESDGGVAILVTSLERARDQRQPVVEILGAAQGIAPGYIDMTQRGRDDMAHAADTAVIGRLLWEQSGLTPADIDVANLYDHYSPAVLMSLEALGFCGPGEAPGFVRDEGIGIDGKLPVNTNGGQLSEAYLHGYNGITEVVRQIRGTAVNQVANVQTALVTSGSHVPTSGLVLGRG